MRFIDIAVATLIGTAAMAGIATLSPRSMDSSSQRLLVQSELRDSILNHSLRPGVILVFENQPQMICQVVSDWSNSSLHFTATVDGVSCGPTAPASAVAASLTIQVTPEEVVMRAWKTAGA